MSTIQSTTSAQRVAWAPGAEQQRSGGQMPNGPVLPDAGIYGLGIDFIAAALASKAAESTLGLSREVQRSEKLQQASEQRQQADALRDKASATIVQASVSAGFSAGGGLISLGSAASLTSQNTETACSKALGALGSTTSALSQPMGTLLGGARAIELEADASMHGASAKTAEGIVEELASLERQAHSIIDKATSLMQSLVQERQAMSRAILRAG